MEINEKENLLKCISSYCRDKINRNLCGEYDCAFCHVNDTYNEVYDDIHKEDVDEDEE